MMGEALLVAKHATFRQALAIVLEGDVNVKITQAGSPAEVRQVLREPHAKPNLAVVVLELPNGDGVELIEEIRGVWPRVRVLALTSGDPERDARAKEAGAGEVLTMAASAENLLEAVRRLGGS
jgi:DNA-binding NarL/FixJ family response regulator